MGIFKKSNIKENITPGTVEQVLGFVKGSDELRRFNASSSMLGYRVLRGVINQSGTNAPELTVMQDDFDGDLTFSYQGVGSYQIDSASGLFVQGKTFHFLDNMNINGVGASNFKLHSIGRNDNNSLYFTTQLLVISGELNSISYTASNGLLYEIPFEIIIYN